MKRHSPMRRARGFSLIELMISLVIGMLALMFATRLILGAEQNKQAALGGSDSMQNGMLAMFSISNDAAQAGYGLNDPIVVGCDTVMTDAREYTLAPALRDGVVVHPLAAAVIEPGGTGPDRISLYAGTSMTGTGTLRVNSTYPDERTDFLVDRVPYGFAQNDVILVAPEAIGTQCALAEISSDPSTLVVGADPLLRVDVNPATRFNAVPLGPTFVKHLTRMFNLGPARNLSFHTWSVSNGFLQLRATDLAGASKAASTVVDNVVSIKAQYGFDRRAPDAFNPETGMQVTEWSPIMLDADGDGFNGGALDYQRITALRIAVVARSKSPERPAPGVDCASTTAFPVVFRAVEPDGATVVPMTVDVSVAGDPVDWKCYRYRVFETIVPMRNSAWRPTA